MALDADGRIYVCAAIDHAVWVFEPDGTEVDRLQLPGPGMVTNCCFGGADRRTLFVTEGQPGSVVAFEGLPTLASPSCPGAYHHQKAAASGPAIYNQVSPAA